MDREPFMVVPGQRHFYISRAVDSNDALIDSWITMDNGAAGQHEQETITREEARELLDSLTRFFERNP